MKHTDKERMNRLEKSKKITRLYSGYSKTKRFKTVAWRIVVECESDTQTLRQAIDAAMNAESGRQGK